MLEDWDSAIKARTSCRTYAEVTLTENEIAAVQALCASHSKGCFGEHLHFSLHDARTFNSANLGDYLGLITNYRYFLVGAVSASAMAFESYAYALETLVLELTHLGLQTCWLGTFNSDFFSTIPLSSEEHRPAVVVLGHAAQTPTSKDKIARMSVRAHRRKPWEQLFFKGSFATPLSTADAGEWTEALEWVRQGPSAGNLQSWRIVKDPSKNNFHFFKIAAKEDYEQRGMHRLDTGIAMCHFDLGTHAQGHHGRWAINDPQIPDVPEKVQYRVTWVQQD